MLIELTANGVVDYLGFRSTPLVGAVNDHLNSESARLEVPRPFILHGTEAEAEIAALEHLTPRTRWRKIASIDDLPDAMLSEAAADVIRRQGDRYQSFMSESERNRLLDIIDGPTSSYNVLSYFRAINRTTAQGESAERFLFSLNQLFKQNAVLLEFNNNDRFFGVLLISYWIGAAGQYPLVVHGNGRVPFNPGEFISFAANVARFDDLTAETNRVLGFTTEEIERAYRVWQISRRPSDNKPKATTPEYVSIRVAKTFLRVLTRARTEREAARVGLQRPAPVMFDFSEDTIGLKQGVSSSDPAAHIAAAASSLMRQLERLADDHSLSNSVPSAGGMIEVALEILVKVRANEYTDADIIELGVDFNSLQWHIDFVRQQIGDATQGELAGLFSSLQMFLVRFKSWREFEKSPSATTLVEPEAFDLAVSLLESASSSKRLLNKEAADRVDRILERAVAANAPNQREGIVRSGENIAAITVESLSQIVADRANTNPPPNELSDAMLRYVEDNNANLQKLAKRRNWPWLNWLSANPKT